MARWGLEVRSYKEETFFHERYRCMRPVHAVKWASIVLNSFFAGEAMSALESRLQQPLLES